YRAALNIACGTDPKRREAILADFDKHFPEWNDKVADLVWELRPAKSLDRLAKMLHDPKLTVAQKSRIVDILGVYDTSDAGFELLRIMRAEVPAEVKNLAVEKLRTFIPNKWKDLQITTELPLIINTLLTTKGQQIAGL